MGFLYLATIGLDLDWQTMALPEDQILSSAHFYE